MGKEKKPKSIGRMIVDLTPLLDVIFIVLIVVLAGQDNYKIETDKKYEQSEQNMKDAEEKVSDMQTEVNEKLSDMEAKVEAYAEQMAAYESINEYFNIVTVYAGYKPENRRLRTIYVLVNNQPPAEINLTPSNTIEAWEECRKLIEDIIAKDETVPLILSVSKRNEDKMLYGDDEAIKNMFFEIQAAHSANVSIRTES